MQTKLAEADAVRNSCSPMDGISSLPPVLLDALFALLFANWELDQVAHAQRYAYLPSAIRSFAEVSKAWFAMFDEHISRRLLKAYTLSVQLVTRQNLMDLRYSLTMRGAYTKRIVVGQLPSFGVAGLSHWAAALSHVPYVEELDVSASHGSSNERVIELVRAAADQCHRVHTLLLPHESRFPVHRQSSSELMTAVFTAMEVWREHGGLRRLGRSLFAGGSNNPVEIADKLIRCCANLRLLDTWRATPDTSSCQQWMVDLDTWTRFCETCTAMEEFNWAAMPFATSFFDIFGKSARPNLRKLMFQVPTTRWDWQRCLGSIDEATTNELKTTGYGLTAVRPEAALLGCAQLEELWVILHCDPQDTVNPDIFGDDFAEEMTARCPRLRRFIKRQIDNQGEQTMVKTPVTMLTRRAIQSLAKLRDLRELDLTTHDITADSLHTLVLGHLHSSVPVGVFKTYRIALVEPTAECRSVFIELIMGFLERLATREDRLRTTWTRWFFRSLPRTLLLATRLI